MAHDKQDKTSKSGFNFDNEDDAVNYLLAADLDADERQARVDEVEAFEQKRSGKGLAPRQRVSDAVSAAKTQPKIDED